MLFLDQYGAKNVSISAVEVYNNKAYDLLQAREELFLKKGKKPTENYAVRIEDAFSIIATALLQRIVGGKDCHKLSSRSHLFIEIKWEKDGICKQQALCDLAGDEKMANKTRLEKRESSFIVKSLEILRTCILRAVQNKVVFWKSSLVTGMFEKYFDAGNVKMVTHIYPIDTYLKSSIGCLKFSSQNHNYETQRDKAKRLVKENAKAALPIVGESHHPEDHHVEVDRLQDLAKQLDVRQEAVLLDEDRLQDLAKQHMEFSFNTCSRSAKRSNEALDYARKITASYVCEMSRRDCHICVD